MEPVIIDDLEIWPREIGTRSWSEAKQTVSDLGPGWRLPTHEEYEGMLRSGMVNLKREAGVRYWAQDDESRDQWSRDNYAYAFSPLHNGSSMEAKGNNYLAIGVRPFDGTVALEYLLKDF